MRAMILVAGLGTRLRPLTEVLPKPAVPVVHRPVVGYLLHAVHAAGVREVVLNPSYLGEVLPRLLGDGAAYGVQLRYSPEDTPIGTGGAVRANAAFLGVGGALLLNGDCLVEVDLAEVVRGHRAARAADGRVVATMVVRADPAAERYGALGLNAAGRVVDFVGRAVVEGEVVNSRVLFTGIHVLEPELIAALPPDGAPCINKTAYPQRIREGWIVRTCEQRGMWSDIGNPEGYLRANLDVLGGRVVMPGPDPRSEGARFVPAGARVGWGGGTVVGPASVGNGAQLAEGAVVGPEVVVGARATVGAGASLRQGVVWPDTRVEPRADLHRVVVFGAPGEGRILHVPPEGAGSQAP